MKLKIILLFLPASLIFSACAGSARQPAAVTTPIPAGQADSPIIAEGRLEPVRYVQVAFAASGTITEVPVQEGQAVKQGDLLVRLGDDSDPNYAGAQLELVQAEQALEDLKNAAGSDLAQAVIDLREAQEAYDDAVDHLNDLKNDKEIPQIQRLSVPVKTAKGIVYEVKLKHIKGPAPAEWILDAENEVALKKAGLEAAQRKYDRMKGGVDVEQLAVLETRLAAANARLAAFTVLAPFDSVVADLNVTKGSWINAGEPAVSLADFSEWLIKTTDLTEIDVVDLAEGDPVTVTLDAIPDVDLSGTIRSIGQSYSESQGDIVYEVTIVLNDTHPAMRWGMTAAVTFE